jgi:hypothetical protein
MDVLAAHACVDLRAFVETCIRNSPAVKKHLKEKNIILPDRPARGNPASKKS